MKRCKQCGESKPVTQYRKYYTSDGYYTKCLQCEKINSRFKYLTTKKNKGNIQDYEQHELVAIQELYDVLHESGFSVPKIGRRVKFQVKDIEQLINQKRQAIKDVIEKASKTIETKPDDLAPELAEWLTTSLEPYTPEYLQDQVIEQLKQKYRPQIGFDGNLNPIYDETHRDILNALQKRFDDYEDGWEDTDG